MGLVTGWWNFSFYGVRAYFTTRGRVCFSFKVYGVVPHKLAVVLRSIGVGPVFGNFRGRRCFSTYIRETTNQYGTTTVGGGMTLRPIQ